MASGPEIYVGNKGNQKYRDNQAYYGYRYQDAISKLRQQHFEAKEKGVPLEYFTWERIVIDECHETLVTNKGYETQAEFKETARRGAREFLGLAQTNISKRPLVAATGVWGLTGTPLLETEARVTELANLMGGTYLVSYYYGRRNYVVNIPILHLTITSNFSLFFKNLRPELPTTGGRKSANLAEICS